ncbi:MAG: 2-(1,2-epoxy-1,2-dihydrophenyl)acetyl-CoA isomerase [Rhizobiales bacterium 65-9]|nr:enoyl-CoA hydratase/isomerase family protein [Hyphomicrobiales bacterium]OJY32397.1 MAG: 2-(1,2-epoxy-1,2-dihydrophenyl)acetyl-CoA isomerase [Rhizobiales bacterium 65-9]
MSYENILFDIADGRATLTLNRPDSLNSLNVAMMQEIRDAIGAIDVDQNARVLVLKGAGRGFCSGADLAKGSGANNGDGPFDAGLVLELQINPLMRLLADVRVPVVAAVHGAAAGVGCALALAADFVVAARSSYFLMAFAKVGLAPDGGATWILPRLVGVARAAEMLMLGERIPAAKASEWGMIYKVADDDQLIAETDALASRLASGPTVAYGLVRRALHAGLSSSYGQALTLERENQRVAGLTEDFAEGVRAFREKRPAVFRGR